MPELDLTLLVLLGFSAILGLHLYFSLKPSLNNNIYYLKIMTADPSYINLFVLGVFFLSFVSVTILNIKHGMNSNINPMPLPTPNPTINSMASGNVILPVEIDEVVQTKTGFRSFLSYLADKIGWGTPKKLTHSDNNLITAQSLQKIQNHYTFKTSANAPKYLEEILRPIYAMTNSYYKEAMHNLALAHLDLLKEKYPNWNNESYKLNDILINDPYITSDIKSIEIHKAIIRLTKENPQFPMYLGNIKTVNSSCSEIADHVTYKQAAHHRYLNDDVRYLETKLNFLVKHGLSYNTYNNYMTSSKISPELKLLCKELATARTGKN